MPPAAASVRLEEGRLGWAAEQTGADFGIDREKSERTGKSADGDVASA